MLITVNNANPEKEKCKLYQVAKRACIIHFPCFPSHSFIHSTNFSECFIHPSTNFCECLFDAESLKSWIRKFGSWFWGQGFKWFSATSQGDWKAENRRPTRKHVWNRRRIQNNFTVLLWHQVQCLSTPAAPVRSIARGVEGQVGMPPTYRL